MSEDPKEVAHITRYSTKEMIQMLKDVGVERSDVCLGKAARALRIGRQHGRYWSYTISDFRKLRAYFHTTETHKKGWEKYVRPKYVAAKNARAKTMAVPNAKESTRKDENWDLSMALPPLQIPRVLTTFDVPITMYNAALTGAFFSTFDTPDGIALLAYSVANALWRRIREAEKTA